MERSRDELKKRKMKLKDGTLTKSGIGEQVGPPGYYRKNSTIFTISLPKPLYTAVIQEAKKRCIYGSKSGVVREALERLLLKDAS
jgi:hypothetical protein